MRAADSGENFRAPRRPDIYGSGCEELSGITSPVSSSARQFGRITSTNLRAALAELSQDDVSTEQSGAHRVPNAEIRDVRELLVAVSAVSMLARSTNVGPRALREQLADVRAACVAAPASIAASLIGPCKAVALSTGLEDEPRQVLRGLTDEVQVTANRAIAAVDEALARGIGARTRIALQTACERAASALSRVQQTLEVLQHAATGNPIPLVIGDLLRELQVPRRGQHPVSGPDSLELAVVGELDAPVLVQPRTALVLLQGTLSCVWRFETPPRQVTAVVRRQSDRVTIEIRPHLPSDRAVWSASIRAERAAAVDEALVKLVVASVAGSLQIETQRVMLMLLCA